MVKKCRYYGRGYDLSVISGLAKLVYHLVYPPIHITKYAYHNYLGRLSHMNGALSEVMFTCSTTVVEYKLYDLCITELCQQARNESWVYPKLAMPVQSKWVWICINIPNYNNTYMYHLKCNHVHRTWGYEYV